MTDLEQTAIERLKAASDMRLRLFEKPLLITYSGGKDSDVLLHLAEAADRIEAQAKEIEKLRGQNEQLREAAALVAKESAELLERNYVMSIIADIRKAGKTWMCKYCAHCKGIVSGMADCDSEKPCVMPYGQFELKRPEPPEVENAEAK